MSETKDIRFVHLHNHSHYSLLDGLSKIDQMVARAKELGMPAMGLTDHGSMYGAIDFYVACVAKGIKPIIGVEIYLANRTRFDKEPGIDNKRYHLTLLAKNTEGYRNLIRLVTLANLEGYYYKPRIDKDILREYANGIIALSGCPAGELGRAIINSDNLDRADEIIREYREIFGRENYFLEIMHHPDVENFDKWREALITLSRKHDIPLVATQDSHYIAKDDARAHKTLIAISTNTDVSDTGIFSGNGNYHLISTEEALEYFRDVPDAVANTMMVADKCHIELELGKFLFPEYPLPSGVSAYEQLRALCYAGLKKRGLEGQKDALDRLEYELEIINFKRYETYFLVVEDLIRFAHNNGIYTNIRGSVAGSMTTYLLGITKINPLEYNIPFERFLNPERPSAPDIDMDFADTRREEVLEYAKRKYGTDKVAQIGTFGTMMARGAVRDVARALGKPYDFGDRIAKLIPLGSQGFPMTLDHALEIESDLKKMYDTDRDVREVIDLSKKLEGCVRHISVHAAGVVIAPKPLIEYVPTQYDPRGGKIITQYDMYAVGEDGIGLTKFDFLGIRNLTILENAVRLVKSHRAIDVDIENIPLSDKKTYAMLARGETVGLFQLNGAGMTKWLVELRPTSIHDINAMVALYRPGPMQFIPDYIKRKHNPSLISYLDPALEKILKQTYGILVYQDDLLIMAHQLAGYTWGEVDKFRKAVGKKIPEEMAKQKEKFIKGCISNAHWSEKKAQEVWAWIEPFAAYGFNKAHSASYGRVAYQTAYMKANYPAEYMAAVLSAEAGDTEKIAEVIAECKRMEIPVLPPDINASFAAFTVIKAKSPEEKDQIRFGLHTIKNLGEAIGNAIINEREEGGRYKSFGDFLERVTHKDLNKKSLESLIRTGVFDSLGEERGALLHNIDVALEYNKLCAKERENAQASLFSIMEATQILPTLRLKPAPEISPEDKLAWEKELLGLYISGHPLDKHREKLEKNNINIKQITEDTQEGMSALIAGIIEDQRLVLTKKNEYMAFLRIADFTGSIEVVIFPRTFTEYREILAPDKLIAVKGRFSRHNDSPSVIAEKVKPL